MLEKTFKSIFTTARSLPISRCSSKMARIVFQVSKVVLLLYHITVFYKPVKSDTIDHVLQERIDRFVKNVYFPNTGISGLGFGVVQNDGEVLYTQGYGFADHSRKIPNGNQTQFLLASLSKSITAVVVAKTLHEQFPELGEAVLDTPIKELMPQANFTLVDRVRSEHSTFRDLLSHKMCLDRNNLPIYMEAYESTDDLIYRQRYVKETCGFRSQFVYHNQMFLLASELIGQLISKNFVDYTEQFLKELGMHDSAFIRETDDFSKMENRALPYYIKDGKPYPTNPDLIKRLVHIQAVGGFFSSPNDMVRFARFNLNQGKIDGKQVVPKNVMSWLTKPSNVYHTMQFKTAHENNVVDSHLAYGIG